LGFWIGGIASLFHLINYKMMKNLALILLIALVHFGLSLLIVAASLSAVASANPVPAEPTAGVRILVEATRILHFPVISLALYPRHVFPGNWIYIPMAANSFLWATLLYVLILLGKKIWRFRVQRSRFRVPGKRKD